MNHSIYLCDLNQVGLKDLNEVGGKNASLGEMLQNLSSLGINIPNGFVITVAAYREFIRYNNLDESIRSIINSIDFDDIESLRRGGLQARQLIKNSKFPKDLSEAIINKYHELSATYGQDKRQRHPTTDNRQPLPYPIPGNQGRPIPSRKGQGTAARINKSAITYKIAAFL
jgi:phosphoenolpyruvate synthase/pyruvate phosphate dikinase